MKKTLCTLFVLAFALASHAQMYFGEKKEVSDSVFNSLAQTPPMGWNSWNAFGSGNTAALTRTMADKMVEPVVVKPDAASKKQSM